MSHLESFSDEELEKISKLEKLINSDCLPEQLLDEITSLAEIIFNVSTVVIRIVTSEKKWFISNESLKEEVETEVDSWLVKACLQSVSKFDVPDAFYTTSVDPNQNKEVNAVNRFYMATPIYFSNGEIVGALCLIDKQQISLNENQNSLLRRIAKLASEALLLKATFNEQFHIKNTRLSAIVETSEDAIVSKTLDGIVVSWNQSAQKLFGYSAEEIIGKSITVLFPKERMNEEAYFLRQIKNNKHIKHYETERVHKNGKILNISVSISPIKDIKGQVIGISKIARDITSQKKLQQNLANEHERLRVTLDSIGDAVITTDVDGIIQYLNPVAENLTGFLQEEALGLPLHKVFRIVNEKSRLPVENPIEACISENRIIGLAHQTLLISQNGSEFAIEDSAAPIHDLNGNTIGAVLVFHDVTMQRKMANEMTYRATHDSLTGLLNRLELEETLTHLISNDREPNINHALVYIDLDQFKIINDTCGHSAGDKLLREVAHVMESCIRSTDKVARVGGDEFAIIIERCDPESAFRIAEQIRNSIDEYRFQHDGKRFHIGASLGLVLIDRQWSDVTDLIQAADNACYAAKRDGRNRVKSYFDAGDVIDTRRNDMYWISLIEDAFDNNNFVLYCQRILPYDKQKRLHGEILLRIKGESDQLIPPGLFLPAAERYHLVSRIDRWVVNQIFSWLNAHQNELHHLESISINLSGQSLSDQTFLAYVLDQIENQAPDCNKICFEITETAAITNFSGATKFIELMKQHGIKFSLDDFGSGVSSFAYLKNLNVDYIKIDGQFIQGILTDSVNQATVRCMVEIAKVTGKQTIAEFVEDKAVEILLKAMGVDYTQGFYKHKPAPLIEILNE
jgi:diguanylate cyclase